jgi:hypothetical protein
MYGVPRAWLADGAHTTIANAPTMFGPVSMEVDSKLGNGVIEMRVEPPKTAAKKMTLRAPVPAGYRVESAEVGGEKAPLIDGNVVDLSGRAQPTVVKFQVRRE